MNKIRFFSDAQIMFKRCLKISMRNPESLIMATISPFFLMLMFGIVFGGIANVGNFRYIDFIVPGIIMQSFSQTSQHSALNVTIDMKNGIINRFRCMSISKYAVLLGHIGAGTIRGLISTIIVFITGFILGFRPQSTLTDWLLVILLLLLIQIAITSVAVFCGLISKSVEGSSGLMFPIFILPFISSGFAPVETMPSAVRWFAQFQPMTPMIDSLRALTLGLPLGNSLWIAIGWCVGITIITFVISSRVYKKKAN